MVFHMDYYLTKKVNICPRIMGICKRRDCIPYLIVAINVILRSAIISCKADLVRGVPRY